jgi:hypothetical protein
MMEADLSLLVDKGRAEPSSRRELLNDEQNKELLETLFKAAAVR